MDPVSEILAAIAGYGSAAGAPALGQLTNWLTSQGYTPAQIVQYLNSAATSPGVPAWAVTYLSSEIGFAQSLSTNSSTSTSSLALVGLAVLAVFLLVREK